MSKKTIIGITLALIIVGFTEGMNSIEQMNKEYLLQEPLHQMQDSDMNQICIEEEIPL